MSGCDGHNPRAHRGGRVPHLTVRIDSLMTYVVAPPLIVSVPVVGTTDRFPVHRVYCVGRNYEEHAKEMGATGREAPFFFLKPADAVVAMNPGDTARIPYPTLTSNVHHEVELVVAIGAAARNLTSRDAPAVIYGYAVGLDLTRRDLQANMKKQGRPWCVAKAFDHSAPVGPITPVERAGDIANAAISLAVNGTIRQRSSISKLMWNISEILEHLSAAWELQPGDLVLTGTPEGVGPVARGDLLIGTIDGLEEVRVLIV
jgi:fumarylpyruvate hydrolase